MGNRSHDNKLDPTRLCMREVYLYLEGGPKRMPSIVKAMDGRGFEEETVRAAVWFLVDQGELRPGKDWRFARIT